MRVLIDIPKENYKEMCEYGNERVDFDLKRMIHNGTPIPDNATNGQVIQTLFKPNRVERTNVIVEEYTFNNDWWNAPYQKGGKE